MVVITGDLVDGYFRFRQKDAEPLLDLKSRYGTYHCSGNHEYYWDPLKWFDWLEENGANVLRSRWCEAPPRRLYLRPLNRRGLCNPMQSVANVGTASVVGESRSTTIEMRPAMSI